MSDLLTRAEYLAWAKRRAMEYIEAQSPLSQAFVSMASDLSKHHELAALGKERSPEGMQAVIDKNRNALRRGIEEFQ
jgi:hypothetical protein